ncbi:AAA family ATPase [Nocardioides sp.]|uniref:AAA family ATPase n=1 Tax=Nocardioides sp. TaxID=35761 RepID=UPI002BB3D595|nr:AAA family ATPase [Nocardioides sp.]HXH79915.1 AAA family ATPase [Nocardioides sp.]
MPARVLEARTAVWTPTVSASTREIDQALPRACQQVSYAVDYHQLGIVDPFVHTASAGSALTELLIIDEADRLKTTGLEQVRDYYDRHHLGLILIGMPGIEKRLARYPQLFSRIGCAHQYRALTTDELTAVLTRRWHTSDMTDDDHLAQTTAIATIARITGCNFRLVDRLLAQIERITSTSSTRPPTPTETHHRTVAPPEPSGIRFGMNQKAAASTRPPADRGWAHPRPCGVSQPERSGPCGTMPVGLMSVWTT